MVFCSLKLTLYYLSLTLQQVILGQVTKQSSLKFETYFCGLGLTQILVSLLRSQALNPDTLHF